MGFIQTVCGPIAPQALGRTLIHEHIMVDFIGADRTGPHRWDPDEVVQTMRSYLHELAQRGFRGFVDCTPNYLGRDPLVLKRLSKASGIHLLTNTGLYKEPYLPSWALEAPAEALADRWVAEWREGINHTGIKPGFVKIAVNPGPLIPVQQRIVRAAALTHLDTGLLVASHAGHAVAAHQSLDIVEAAGMDPARYVIVHANNIEDLAQHVELARRGAWLEYDGLRPDSMDWHAHLVTEMLDRGYGAQILISQDAGWYHVGEPKGGNVVPYTLLWDDFLPMLRERGVDETTLKMLLVDNPQRALEIA